MVDLGKQAEAATHERVKGFDRVRMISRYHVYRLHTRAKKYSEKPEDEERYFRALRTLGYLMQVEVAAQRSAFDQEFAMMKDIIADYNNSLKDYERLKLLEDKYLGKGREVAPSV